MYYTNTTISNLHLPIYKKSRRTSIHRINYFSFLRLLPVSLHTKPEKRRLHCSSISETLLWRLLLPSCTAQWAAEEEGRLLKNWRFCQKRLLILLLYSAFIILQSHLVLHRDLICCIFLGSLYLPLLVSFSDRPPPANTGFRQARIASGR